MLKAEFVSTDNPYTLKRDKKKVPEPTSLPIYVLPADAKDKTSMVAVKSAKGVMPLLVRFHPVEAAKLGRIMNFMDCVFWYKDVTPNAPVEVRDRMLKLLLEALVYFAETAPGSLNPQRMKGIRKIIGPAVVDLALVDAGYPSENFPSSD